MPQQRTETAARRLNGRASTRPTRAGEAAGEAAGEQVGYVPVRGPDEEPGFARGCRVQRATRAPSSWWR